LKIVWKQGVHLRMNSALVDYGAIRLWWRSQEEVFRSASKLPIGSNSRLTLLVREKSEFPCQPELTIGSVAGGMHVLAEEMSGKLNVSASDLREIISLEEAGAVRREEFHRSGF